jgi:hypothetical protein
VNLLPDEGSLVRIKVLDKDQGSWPHQCNGDKKKIDEVWERQGLVHNVDCWLQMIDKICIERSLGKRKKIKGFPTCISRLEWSCKGSDPMNLLLQPQKI